MFGMPFAMPFAKTETALRALSFLLVTAFTTTVATNQVAAQGPDEALENVLEQVGSTYGADALTSLRNYEIIESYISPATGQSWHPALTDIGKRNFRLAHDLENSHLYQESWFISEAGLFPNVSLINADGSWTINLRNGSYGEAANADPYAIAGGTMRTTDTLLARELLQADDAAEYVGRELWMNRMHNKVRIPFPRSPDLTLFVDAESGLITRMTRENPQIGLLDYVFKKHETFDGIPSATAVSFSIAGEPNLVSMGRRIRFNQSIDPADFTLPEGLSAEGERLDDSEMVVNRLADNVYHIGQNGGYSVFVDTGREIIGTGGYAGLAARLDRYRSETGNYRPLAYQVVTHHHQDHIGGLDEALALGATLVTVEHTAAALRANSRRELADGSMLFVDGRMTLGGDAGEVQLFDVATNHSASNLLFYVPSIRTLFTADHFGSPFAEGTPVANGNTMSMAAALEGLDLDILRIVTAHGARVFSMRDFERAVAEYSDFDCPDDRPLCAM